MALRPVLGLLIEYGYLRPINAALTGKKPGRPRSCEYELHPSIRGHVSN